MRLVLGLCALILPLAACGDENLDESQAGEAGDLQDCAEVWVDGATLEQDYQGCTEDGQQVAPVVVGCEDGGQLTTYDDAFVARLGGEVLEAPASSAEYVAAYEECTGEAPA